MTRRGRLAAFFFALATILLPPLRAAAAVAPMLIAYDAPVWSTATTGLGAHDAVRSEAKHRCVNAYDAANLGYDGPSNARVGAGTEALHPYDDDPEHDDRREVEQAWAIYDAPATTAAEGAAPAVEKSFFEGTQYTQKVLTQMQGGVGEFYSFPESVTALESAGGVRTITGGDGVVRQMLEIPGSYGGREGVFQFIKEADGAINHRLFVPGPGGP